MSITLATAATAAITTLQATGALQDMLRSTTSGSLVEYTRTTRVEPLVFVDDQLVHLDYMPNVMQALSAIMAGYYLQAVAISVNVGKINTVKLLDRLNPNRDPLLNSEGVINAGLTAVKTALESRSYEFGLPVPGQAIGLEAYAQHARKDITRISTEATAGEIAGQFAKDSIQDYGKTGQPGDFGGIGDSASTLQENINLSVGRLLEVTITDGPQTATIPVSLRLIAVPMSSDNLVHILTVAKSGTSAKERYHGWRSGALHFIKDLIFCQDLIDEHRKDLMGDATDQYKTTLNRSHKNTLSAIVSGKLSLANASNMLVINSNTASKIEASLGGRFKDFRFREGLFKKSYAMIIVVVDTNWERVTIYTRSIETPSQHSIKDLKSAGGRKDIDVGEILKAYQLGSSPSI